MQSNIRASKDSALDLTNLRGSSVKVELYGGRTVTGVLRGHDALTNLVLDRAVESQMDNNGSKSERELGFVVIKGGQVSVVALEDQIEEISNPF